MRDTLTRLWRFLTLADLDKAAEPEAAATHRANALFDGRGPDERDDIPGGRRDRYPDLFPWRRR